MDKGRADFLDVGDWNVSCYECGRKRKASEMVKHWQGYYVCARHNEPRHPQDYARAVQDVQTPPWTQDRSYVYAKFIYTFPWSPTGSTLTDVLITPDGIFEGGELIVPFLDPPSPVYPPQPVSPPFPGDPPITGRLPDGTIDPRGNPPAADGTPQVIIINIPGGVKLTSSDPTDPDLPPLRFREFPPGLRFIVNNDGEVYGVPDADGHEIQWNGAPYPPPDLIFYVQPTDVAFPASISPAIQVMAVNKALTIIPTFTEAVTLEIGNNPGDPILGELSGTLTQNAVDGIATFSNISIDQSGDGYTLLARYLSQPAVESNSFNVTVTRASGGYVSVIGDYTYHSFTYDAFINGDPEYPDTDFTAFTVLIAPLTIDYVIVGGGGTFHSNGGGGGGGGGVSIVQEHIMTETGTTALTVGNGGRGDFSPEAGESTTFITTVIGGAPGGDVDTAGGNGACGGGGGAPSGAGTTSGGTGSVGFNGGNGFSTAVVDTAGGGGGGMGSTGTNAADYPMLGVRPGNGGAGLDLTTLFPGFGTAGSGGGGFGSSGGNWYYGTDGTDGYGAGGSTDRYDATPGVVIIRYLS